MATNLTKAQLAALDVLKARLDPQDPGFRGDETITAALEAGRPYIDTWVLPLIAALQNDSWERKEALRGALYDAAVIRHARTTAKFAKLAALNPDVFVSTSTIDGERRWTIIASGSPLCASRQSCEELTPVAKQFKLDLWKLPVWNGDIGAFVSGGSNA